MTAGGALLRFKSVQHKRAQSKRAPQPQPQSPPPSIRRTHTKQALGRPSSAAASKLFPSCPLAACLLLGGCCCARLSFYLGLRFRCCCSLLLLLLLLFSMAHRRAAFPLSRPCASRTTVREGRVSVRQRRCLPPSSLSSLTRVRRSLACKACRSRRTFVARASELSLKVLCVCPSVCLAGGGGWPAVCNAMRTQQNRTAAAVQCYRCGRPAAAAASSESAQAQVVRAFHCIVCAAAVAAAAAALLCCTRGDNLNFKRRTLRH